MALKEEKKAGDKSDEVITAVYRVNLHCQQCARDIKKPLMSTQGIHNVDVDIEKAEIKVKGVIDPLEIHRKLEKMSKKKVELVSPQVKKDTAASEKKPVKETEAAILRTTSVKVHMHCDKCEDDLRKRLLKHRGIHSVKTDMKTQNLTVQGTIEPDKLITYIQKKVHKNAEILASETQKTEGKKELKNTEAKTEEKKEPKKPEAKSTKGTEIEEFKTEKKVEAKTKEGNAPYFIHYVYAPQLFSDENPNACITM